MCNVLLERREKRKQVAFFGQNKEPLFNAPEQETRKRRKKAKGAKAGHKVYSLFTVKEHSNHSMYTNSRRLQAKKGHFFSSLFNLVHSIHFTTSQSEVPLSFFWKVSKGQINFPLYLFVSSSFNKSKGHKIFRPHDVAPSGICNRNSIMSLNEAENNLLHWKCNSFKWPLRCH